MDKDFKVLVIIIVVLYTIFQYKRTEMEVSLQETQIKALSAHCD